MRSLPQLPALHRKEFRMKNYLPLSATTWRGNRRLSVLSIASPARIGPLRNA